VAQRAPPPVFFCRVAADVGLNSLRQPRMNTTILWTLQSEDFATLRHPRESSCHCDLRVSCGELNRIDVLVQSDERVIGAAAQDRAE
jgi:hypothetical protein